MITAPVSGEKLDYWKKLWKDNISFITPNKITGTELNEYFCKKYSPTVINDISFHDAVSFNLKQRYSDKTDLSPQIVCYLVGSDIYVGIDLVTGFFHIECERIDKCIPVYDDLYIKRGLDKDDLQNYVLTGQYLELVQTRTDRI